MLRGNGGRNIFFSAEDRTRLYLLLQEGVERYGHRIHAFCLMDNHVHFAMQVNEISLSKIIQNLSFRYTRHVNATQKKTGHLFQGRYKAILIDADDYLLQLVRYIHNNPVRAGITRQCANYQWSSHMRYCGEVSIPWLTTDWVLGQFSDHSERAPSMLAEPGRKRDVSEARAVTALLTLDVPNLTCTDLAAIFRRDLSSLSQAAGRLRKRMVTDSTLTARLDEAKRLL